MRVGKKVLKNFRRLVWRYWERNGRHDLAWRQTKDSYRILVSEIMLQQTQVGRVIPKYKEFLREFPNPRVLAKAPLSKVLRVWSGLGYNKRAKFLRDAAREVVARHHGRVPRGMATLRTLPGVGNYTAKAVRVFARNEPEVLIETNIRTAFIHHFYTSVLQKTAIDDVQILHIASRVAEGQDPKEWHWALMDYGAHLKEAGVRLNVKSAHYTKQSKFHGSRRQARGVILRELHKGSCVEAKLSKLLKNKQLRNERPRRSLIKKRLNLALTGLRRDGLIEQRGKRWCVVN